MVTKPKKDPRGRKPSPPEEVRSERLVLRVHPDLMWELTMHSRANGITRSTYIERILIGFLNMNPEQSPKLDAIGRHIDKLPVKAAPLVTAKSFDDRWAQYGAVNQAIFGNRPDQRGPDFEDERPENERPPEERTPWPGKRK